MIGLSKFRIKACEGIDSGRFYCVGGRAGDNLTARLYNPRLSNGFLNNLCRLPGCTFSPGLHCALRFTPWLGSGNAFELEHTLGSTLRGERTRQFFVARARDKEMNSRISGRCSRDFFLDRRKVLIPRVVKAQGHAI